MPKRELHLNLNAFSTGVYPGVWIFPDVPDDSFFSVAHYQHLAKIAERGMFDAFFLGDASSLAPHVGANPPTCHTLDPTLLLASIAGVTSHIGLVATASTTYNAPYDIARKFASLDFISHGRAGWNAVTTFDPNVAANYGDQPHPSRDTRYRRAGEFIRVVRQLWDSWDDDAIVADRDRREYIHPGAITPIDHVGEFFSVKGPMQIPRPPQGNPVVFQAGDSAAGRDFAAREADAIFSLDLGRPEAEAFAADVRGRARQHGRDPSSIVILPGLITIVGGTEAEARARQAELLERADAGPTLERLATLFRVDPEALSLDSPVPPELIPEETGGWLTPAAEVARRGLTVREILQIGGGGHRLIVGAPDQVADTIADWFEHGACDGFNLMPAAAPSGLEAFVEHVVPILQQRGIFRREYVGTTLREHLGLSRRRPMHVLAESPQVRPGPARGARPAKDPAGGAPLSNRGVRAGR